MSQLESVTIRLPWPSKKLHAHNEGHWRSKTSAVKASRLTAKICAIGAQRHLSDRARWEKATIEYRFYVPNMLRRDEANMIQSCKPAVDGVVDSELIIGDHWTALKTGKVIVELDRENPRVELIFTEAE